ncbi:MAG TPA: NAD(P)/FAD-dependent oxidoreductase [Thermoanaerobaculia bacterium]|nr:NAD(P)/FAD-dependent oxidoreductase [Thermoanaerobaculia bacterium]
MNPNEFQGTEYWVPVGKAVERIKKAPPRPGRRFLILGAGMAGLAAAYELQQLPYGYEVQILEGSARVGGRVLTHRFRNGSRGECGAMRIPMAHDYTHHYAEVVGLGPEDWRRFWNTTRFFDVGGRFVPTEDFRTQILPLFYPGLKPEEQRVVDSRPARDEALGALLQLYMEPIFRQLTLAEIQALLAGDFRLPKLQAFDARTWLQVLQAQGASPAALELLGRGLSLKASWNWSFAAILRDELAQANPDNPGRNGIFCEIKEGMDRLTDGLASRLRPGTIRLDSQILGIRRVGDQGGLVLVMNTRTRESSTVPFDFLLCTLPFSVLRQLQIFGFSQEKMDAIETLPYVTSSKVFLNYDRRWWEEAPFKALGGRLVSDQPDGKVLIPRQSYFPADGTPAPCEEAPLEEAGLTAVTADGERLPGLFSLYTGETPPPAPAIEAGLAAAEADRPGTILAAYTLTEGAEQACADPDPVRRVLQSLPAPLAEPATRLLKESFAWCWNQSEWTKGAFAITTPGYLSRYFQLSKREEGSVYFAGEHVSITPGWIQGSLESSLREVARMLERA